MEQAYVSIPLYNILITLGWSIIAGGLLLLLNRGIKRMDDIVVVIGGLTTAVNNLREDHGLQLSGIVGRVRMVESKCEDIPKLWELAHKTEKELGKFEGRMESVVIIPKGHEQ